MTLEQFEQRLRHLKDEVAALRRELKPLIPLSRVEETFGLLGDDPEFDEIVRLGREYRDQANKDQ